MSDTALEQPKRHPHRKDYSEEEIELGLSVLAYCAGDRRRAAKQLEEDGIAIPPGTLYYWATDRHSARYEDLRRRLAPRIQARMAAKAEDLATRYLDAEEEAVEIFFAKKEDLEARDAAKAAQQFAVAKGIAVEKGLLLRGQPTSIEMRMDIDDLFARLGQTAVVDAEVVEEDATSPEPASKHALT